LAKVPAGQGEARGQEEGGTVLELNQTMVKVDFITFADEVGSNARPFQSGRPSAAGVLSFSLFVLRLSLR